MTTAETRSASLAVGQERRLAVARLRHAVRAGTVEVTELLLEPPDELANLSVYDVMMLGRQSRAKGSASARHLIGQSAVRDRVNVLVSMGRASERTREWAAVNAPRRSRRSTEAAIR